MRLLQCASASLFVFLAGSFATGFASNRTDIIVLKNGDRVTGSIRTMKDGVLDVKCDWGDNHFDIYWDQVKHIESDKTLSIELSDGRRIRGTLEKRTEASEKLGMRDQDGVVEEFALPEIAFLHEGVEAFAGRFDGSLDVGYSLTKSNSTQQLNVDARLTYDAEEWVSVSGASALFSSQNDATDTERYAVASNLRRMLRNNWFLIGGADFLRSTELDIDLRSVFFGGPGRYLKRDSEHLLAVFGGAAWNRENYSDPEIPNGSSPELTGSVAFNKFNLLGDKLSMINELSAYKSVTQSNRFRFDLALGLRWKLPRHFYFNFTFRDNFDNSPPSGDTPNNDFVFTTGFGWSP